MIKHVVCFKLNEGESVEKAKEVLLEKEKNCLNIMGPCLLKLQNGELGMLYAQKDQTESGFVVCFQQLFGCLKAALSHFVCFLIAHTRDIGIFFDLLAEDDEEQCR